MAHSVFITGHTGFKGAWLCGLLLKKGYSITGYALEAPPDSLFAAAGLSDALNSIEGDIRDREKLFRAMREAKPDIVYHLAAQPIVRIAYDNPFETYEVNVMGTVNVLDALRETKSVKSFVNVTTDKVYENKEWFWAYRENERLCGHDPYSNSKSCSELITHSYRVSFFDNNGPVISTARSGNVIGGGDNAPDRIIPDCVRAAKAKKTIIVRNPYSTRPYQHVLDTLNGYINLAEKQIESRELQGAYNFSPDDAISNGELVSLFCELWKDDISWLIENKNSDNKKEARFLRLDSSKAKAELGWKQKWNIKTTLEKIIEYSRLDNNQEKKACFEKQIESFLNGLV